MARIRAIKPEFWSSGQVMECSPLARLMFIGLWNFCDDAGRMVLSCKRIKAQIFPADDMDAEAIRRMIDDLSTNDLVYVYRVDGKEFLQVTGWHHQKIDRPRKSDLPSPPESLDDLSTNDRGSFDAGSNLTQVDRSVANACDAHAPAREDGAEEDPRQRKDYEEIEAKLRLAAGLENDPSPSLLVVGPILGLMDAGADLEQDILPVLRAKAKAGQKGRSWNFYTGAIEDGVKARRKAGAVSLPAVKAGTPPDVWNQWVEGYRQKRSWLPALGPDPSHPDCRAPLEILAANGFAPTALDGARGQ